MTNVGYESYDIMSNAFLVIVQFSSLVFLFFYDHIVLKEEILFSVIDLLKLIFCLFQDAKKGVLFIDFPPVLQLHLKRFEYDFVRDVMVKVRVIENVIYSIPSRAFLIHYSFGSYSTRGRQGWNELFPNQIHRA